MNELLEYDEKNFYYGALMSLLFDVFEFSKRMLFTQRKDFERQLHLIGQNNMQLQLKITTISSILHVVK